MSDTGELMAKLGLDKSEFVANLNECMNDVKGFNEVLGELGIGLGFGAALEEMKQLAERAKDIENTARALNLTTAELQALNYVADETGLGQDKMQMALVRVNVAADACTDSHSKQAKALAELGINTEEFQSLDSAGRLELIAKAAAEATDKHAAFNAVTEILGARLAPWATTALEELAEKGLGGVIANAQSMGQVMDAGVAPILTRTINNFEALKNATENVFSRVLAGAQLLMDYVGYIGAKIDGWFHGRNVTIDDLREFEASMAKVKDHTDAVAEKTQVIAATTAQLREIEAAIEKYKLSRMTMEEQIEYHLTMQEAATKAMDEAAPGSTQQAAAKLEIFKQQAAIDKLDAEQRAAADKAQKAADDARAKAQDEWSKAVEALWAKQDKARYDAETHAQRVLDLTQQIKDLEDAIAVDGENSTQGLKDQAKIIDLNTELTKEQVAADKDALDAINAQNAALQAQATLLGAITHTGTAYSQQSTANLQFVAQNLQSTIGRRSAADWESGVYLAADFDSVLQDAKAQLQQVNAELAARQNAASLTATYGSAAAAQMIGPDEYARLEALNTNTTAPSNDQLSTIAASLQTIQKTLTNTLTAG